MQERSNKNLILIFATFGVAFLHANNYSGSFNNDTSWKISYFFNLIFMCSVPLFFMITGSNLLGFRQRYSGKEYLKRRIPMIYFYLIWNLLYYLIYIFIGRYQNFSFPYFIYRVSSDFFLDLFWFIKPLFEIYFSIYFVSYISSKKNSLLFLSFFLFLNYFIIPTLNSRFNLNIVSLEFFSKYLIYSVMGYLIDNFDFSFRTKNYVIIFVTVLLYNYFSSLFFVTGSLSSKFIPTNGYISVSTMLMTVCLYKLLPLLFKFFLLNNSFNIILSFIASISIGFFAVQDFFMHFLKLYSNQPIGYRMIYMPFILWILCLICSYLVSKIKLFNIGNILLAKNIKRGNYGS